MTTIWIPIVFSVVFLWAGYDDYKDDWELIKKYWASFLVIAAIKPGLFIVAIWWLWVLLS